MYQNAETSIEVPHTAQIRLCHTCLGASVIRCGHCHGAGRERCVSCNGSGRVASTVNRNGHIETVHVDCNFCFGSGRRTCHRCHGAGRVQCPTCLGRTNLKFFLKLTIKWTVFHTDRYVEKTDLPDDLIKNAKGTILLNEDYPRVAPIVAFPIQEVVTDSQATVQDHFQKYTGSGLILRQRQVLRQVPVSEVKYHVGEKSFRYFVYGLEHKVFDDEYPQTCLWCRCSIL